jgi:DNA-binding IclR family transcriptional regulator
LEDGVEKRRNGAYLSTLGSGLDVLGILAREPFLTIADISQRASCDAQKAYRLLSTLHHDGYVSRTAEKTYYLGPAAISIGFAAYRRHPLVDRTGDVLDWLVEKTHTSACLVIRRGHARVILDARVAPHRLRNHAPIGEDLPLHVSGAGLTLLAHSGPETIEAVLSKPLAALTERTETDPAKVRKLLGTIRERGYHFAKGDSRTGIFSVAAPAFNASNECVAAIAAAGPTAQLTPELEEELVQRVLEATIEVSTRQGYVGFLGT